MTRARLENRREADTFETIHSGPQGGEQVFILTIGRYDDGRVGEVFVEVPDEQKKFTTAMLGKDIATLISIALQHGASVEELRAATGRSEQNRMGKMVEMPHTLVGTVLDALSEAAA
jgi:hypothetical protein